ncbi:MAG: phage protease [Opitutales bacterium]|jgi:hypothetical protein
MTTSTDLSTEPLTLPADSTLADESAAEGAPLVQHSSCGRIEPTGLGAANALPGDDSPNRWLKLADYGDWPHPAGLQRLTHEAAARMAHGFKSLLGRLRRRFTGIPIYIGHPDDPAFAGQPGHNDTRAYAWVSNLEARPDGLHLLARWSEPGRELLRHAFYKFLSPRWQMRPLSPGVYEPTRLISIGLTNHPNIPGEAVANHSHARPSSTKPEPQSPKSAAEPIVPLTSSPEPEAENRKPETPLTVSLGELLDALDLDPSAPPTTLLSNAEQLAAAARESRESQLEAARFYRLCNDAQVELRTANHRADGERSARIELVLDLAELRGQIPPAERSSWRDCLQGDFDRTLVAIANQLPANQRPTLSSNPLTARLATRRPGAAALAHSDPDRLLALVNERMAKTGEDYSTAWSRVKRTRADLFDASTFSA